MNYRFFPSLVLRTPLYGFRQFAETDYPALLKSGVFKKSLFLSSEAFFEELSKKDFDYLLLNEKQRHTVRKYVNRAAFRATPFGMFAAVSLTSWSPSSDARIVLEPQPLLYLKPDFSILSGISNTVLTRDQDVKLFPNQSIFFAKNDIRYIRRDFSLQETRFSMVAAPRNSLLHTVLRLARNGISKNELFGAIARKIEATEEEIRGYIMELEAEQLLVHSGAPSITGNDYAQELLPYVEKITPLLQKRLNKLMDSRKPALSFLRATARRLSAYTFEAQRPKSCFYCVAERPVKEGGLPMKFQQQVKEGLRCLQQLSTYTPSADLEHFRKAFLAQYEREEVPLLEALDPQLGIGYGSFGEMGNQVLISSLGLNPVKSSAPASTSTSSPNLAALLVNEWMQQRKLTGIGEVEITPEHLRATSRPQSAVALPPTIYVMFRVVNGQVIIESAGGASALQMTGRFSVVPAIEKFTAELAKHEQKTNPDVAFAEIAHFCNIHAANINRRAHLRQYEIPVLTRSTLPQSRQIALSDLMVSVVNDRVVLRSVSLRKPVVPRLGSAYNYTRNSLPVFRFLCDIQSQQLHTHLSLSLSAAVPGLKFYPRVRYRSCIVHEAEWHLYEEDLAPLSSAVPTHAAAVFRELAAEIHLPRYVALTIHDNFIVYDLHTDADIIALLREIRLMPKVVLKEFTMPHETLIRTREGVELMGQYIAALYLDEPAYGKLTLPESKKTATTPRDTANWLYFKIYCHPLSAENILLQHLLPIVEKGLNKGTIQQWFWLRYNDPDHHLRIRVKAERHHHGKLFEALNQCLNKLFQAKTVHRFQTDVYKRELERYSAPLIGYVEALFHCSSNIVVQYLQTAAVESYGEEDTVVEGVAFMNRLLEYFGVSGESEAAFCKNSFEQFYQEHGSVKGFKTEAEKLYKTLEPGLEEALLRNKTALDYTRVRDNVRFLLVKLAGTPKDGPTLESLAADIIHMHMNRLFSNNQRYYEMLVYFMLYRHLTVRSFRQRPS